MKKLRDSTNSLLPRQSSKRKKISPRKIIRRNKTIKISTCISRIPWLLSVSPPGFSFVQVMIIYWHIYLLSSAVLNNRAAGLLALSKWESDRRGVKLNMEIQNDTGQILSAVQSEACYHWDRLDWETPEPAWTINTPLVYLCFGSLSAFVTQAPEHTSGPVPELTMSTCCAALVGMAQLLKPNLQNQISTVERRDGCRWHTS